MLQPILKSPINNQRTIKNQWTNQRSEDEVRSYNNKFNKYMSSEMEDTRWRMVIIYTQYQIPRIHQLNQFTDIDHGHKSKQRKRDTILWDYNWDCFCKVCKNDRHLSMQDFPTIAKCVNCQGKKRCFKMCDCCHHFMCSKCYDNFQIKS